MPDPQNLNIPAAAAVRADLTDPVLREYALVDRVRRLRGDVADGFGALMSPSQRDLSVNPTHQDTLVIGDDTYEFIATGTGTVVADDGNIAVAIGGNAAATQAALVAAINGTASAEHATITLADASTPAIGIGSLPVFGMVTSNVLSVLWSTKQGKDPSTLTLAELKEWPAHTDGIPSVPLSDTLTAGGDWTFDDLDFANGWVFNPAYGVASCIGLTIAVTTEMVAAGAVVIYPVAGMVFEGVVAQAYDSSGTFKAYDDSTFTVSGGYLIVGLGTTGSVDPADGDRIDLIAFGRRVGTV